MLNLNRFSRIVPLCLGLLCLAPLSAQEQAVPAGGEPARSRSALLKQILITDSAESALKLPPQPGGRFVEAKGALSFLSSDELIQRLIAAKDRQIDGQLLGAIVQVIKSYLSERGFPITDVMIPTPQSVAAGAVRIAVVLGKFREIKFVGNRWFSESQLRGDLQVSRGEIIRFSALNDALGWTNDSNPFRRMQAHIEQVGNTSEADLIIGVQERLPLRVVALIDNTGNAALGHNHYTLAATYANLWKMDHQATYQYITTNRGQNFIGHVFSYRAPLPWRHYLQLNATYLRARPVLFGGYFNQDAQNITGDLRYTVPLRKEDNPGELFANLSFKESNNDLQFGGTSVQNSKTDIFEVTLGASKVRRDKQGVWVFGANATLSPGHFNTRNSATAFTNARFGTKARYAYGDFTFQRVQALERGWEFNSRGSLQVADSNLLSSEQLTIGGSATVRGFNENVFAGDEGFVFDNEILAPAWQKNVFGHGKTFAPLETRFLAFYDAAHVRTKHAFGFDPKFRPLASTGVGVRMNWASNFSLSADYGWQITHLPYAVTEHGRGHIKVTLAY